MRKIVSEKDLNGYDIKKCFLDSRIFSYNETFCIFPALGCFVKGYILLATLEHEVSLYNCSEDIVNGVEKTIVVAKEAFKTNMNCGMVYCEHGTIDDFDLCPSSIDHFHIHFLPAKEPVWDKINAKYNFEYYHLNSLKELKEAVDKYIVSSYLLFGDFDGKIYLINCYNKNYHSQFLRKVMYEYYYGSTVERKWDWKEYAYYDNMIETIEIMGSLKI